MLRAFLAADGVYGPLQLHWLAKFAEHVLAREPGPAGALVCADAGATAALARLMTLQLLRLSADLAKGPDSLDSDAVATAVRALARLLPHMLARCEAAGSSQLAPECLDGVAVCAASFMALLDSEVRGWGLLR